MNSSDTNQARIGRRQIPAMIVGLLALALLLLFGLRNPTQLFRSYLFAYVFWAVVPLGCMGVLMLHHMTGGWWGYPIRRILEAGTRTLPLVFVLFLPILAGMTRLYPWAQPSVVAADPILEYKKPYLNPTFFTVRTFVYFAIWILLASLLNKWSSEQDRTGDPRLKLRMTSLSGPGFILWGVMLTLAVIDWVMSLEPHWFSTMYGLLFMVTSGLAAMSFSVIVLRRLSDREPLKDCVEPKRFLDIGNLMLAMVLLWTYMSFSQFLIIWSGNLKNEIPWYKERAFGGWAPVAAFLLIFHFFFPFFLLLQRGVKRRLHVLSMVAVLLFVLTLVDIYWIVVPSWEVSGPKVHALDLLAIIGIGGVWASGFLWQLKKWPLLPLHDPRFEGVLEHQHGD
ncbi:MAG: hypothetical protein ABR973_11180 [Candidatus Acidiferrales bacterium]|jgi:hypothetical protein